MREIISLIPARGGSKGIPRKNIKLLNGKPLINYSIEFSLACPLISRTIVSTDDEEIAEIAKKAGAEVPFLRPEEFAQDDSQDYVVFKHAIEWLQREENFLPELIVQLRPTSPLRPRGLIESAVKLIRDNDDADCLRTIIEAPVTPYKMWSYEDQFIKPFVKIEGKESYNMNWRLLPKVYWHDGVLDIVKSKTVLEKKSVSGDNILPMLMEDSRYSIDIDRPSDFLFAEFMSKKLIEKNSDENIKY